MTSSIKPKVHSLLQQHQIVAEQDQATAIGSTGEEICSKICSNRHILSASEVMTLWCCLLLHYFYYYQTHRQTDRHTRHNTLLTSLYHPHNSFWYLSLWTFFQLTQKITRGKVLSWEYRSLRKQNSRPHTSVILCWVSWVENELLIYYASSDLLVCLYWKLVCLYWKKSTVYGVFGQ